MHIRIGSDDDDNEMNFGSDLEEVLCCSVKVVLQGIMTRTLLSPY